MTMPPGWYPDPGHAGEGPPPERWWDGATWTGRTRPAGTIDEEPAGAGTSDAAGDGGGAARPAQPEGDPPQTGAAWGGPAGSTPPAAATDQPWLLPEPLPEDDSGTARRAWRIAGIAAAVVVGGALVTGGVLLAAAGSDDGAAADDAGAVQPDDPEGDDDRDGAPDDPDDPDESDDPDDPDESDSSDAPAEFTDARVAEVLLPVPDGWSERSFTGAAVTAGEYPCPGDAERTCVQAGAFLEEAEGDDPRTVAEQDVEEHVAASYAEGTHGDVVDQQEERAEEVTVAGGAGYRVRLRVETGAGTDAYAESVAFAAPDGSGRVLVLRLGWADAPGAPSGEDMDDLVASVRPVPPSGAGTEV